MRFIYGKNDWKTRERGQENCYLLTNGLGGYSSLSMIGSNTRNDHALFMSCEIAPNYRYHLITNLEEEIRFSGEEGTSLSSQEYVQYTKNQSGYFYLNQFELDFFPIWVYQVKGVEIKKMVVMEEGSNTLGIQYEINNRSSKEVNFHIVPLLQFVPKGETLDNNQYFSTTLHQIESNGIQLRYKTNGEVECYNTNYMEDLYYSYDSRDGRNSIGKVAHNHKIMYQIAPGTKIKGYIIYTRDHKRDFDQVTITSLVDQEIKRQAYLKDQAKLTNPISLQLVKSADQFIVNRESTGGRTIMAGYPFFADWGRDTMIAMIGCCITTKRYEDAKNIFRSFIQYCNKGIMPNMFPEGGSEPLYNTVDASLLFILALYEYYIKSQDIDFVMEAYPVMEDIIQCYKEGTEYHIIMEEDGLISAGSGLEQVTWMDVRFGDILPTPRHGKPVEINAYWYNSLKIMELFSVLLEKDSSAYELLALKVKDSFNRAFWNEEKQCLKDLVSGELQDDQIRCNQIWAVSQPFSLLSKERERQVVDKVYETLYTPYGLRSLEPEDRDFHKVYGGSHFDRDMAYHQGTVWGFPLGAYYLAYLKINDDSKEAASDVMEQLSVLEGCMREGCIGQIPEIYDGEIPTESRGCFAQAWSVSELLRVCGKLEEIL